MAKKKRGEKKWTDMGEMSPDLKPIPDTFENVVKVLVKPVVPKKEEGEKRD